jgi:hypothetical protein
MASKVKSLAALVDNQLPDFIASEYPKFSAFMQKYYEQLELPGQPLDLVNNVVKYRDIDTYSHELLKQETVLTQNVAPSDTTILVESTSSFPNTNGYVLIGNEVIFYKSKTSTSFTNCYRNVSATTKLGDLYSSIDFKSVSNDQVGIGSQTTVGFLTGDVVLNISNLFLYSLIKNFEKEYLSSFPEASLKTTADKSLLIKNIKKFYAAKGTESSIKFLFNSLVPSDQPNDPTVWYPKDSTYKASSGEWISNYSLKVKLVGNVSDIRQLIGARINQSEDPSNSSIGYASAVIDNIISIGEGFYEVILAESSVVGQFSVISQTYLTAPLLSTASVNKRVNVYSTSGWKNTSGSFVVGSETIQYKSKTVNQFVIENRGSNPITYSANTPVFEKSNVSVSYIDALGSPQTRSLLILGILYNLEQKTSTPYSVVGDAIQIAPSGFETKSPIIFRNQTNSIRWLLNENNTFSSITSLSEVPVNVSAIYEDEQYYYVASSGYPGYTIGKNTWNITLEDQKHLKLIRKTPTRTTEIYETTNKDVGILVNGVPIRGVKDEERITFGEITQVEVTNKGSGYLNPPKVLVIDSAGVSGVADVQAVLSGDTIDRIDVIDPGQGFFPPVPTIVITSGRNATVDPIITNGRVTSLKVTNPGEYYTTPPKILIKDSSGKGRFASFTAVISDEGELTGFVKNDEGKFYDPLTTTVEVESIGSGAQASSIVRTWTKNRFEKIKSNMDSNYGHYFINNNLALGYGYAHIANPKDLRIALNDNLDNVGNVPSTLVHSPILGYAYDGNPIYGPYGYQTPGNAQSGIARMRSSYRLKISRPGGPSTSAYPLGSFIEDYEYSHRFGDLDENNGRFCVTPDYPNGTYAYFVTIESNNTPAYPYFLGKNYYSIPVDSNYNKTISQDDLPNNITRLRTSRTSNNGDGVVAFVESVTSGSVSDVSVFSSSSNFSVGSKVDVNYDNSGGKDILAEVSSVKGKPVDTLLSSFGIYTFFDYFSATIDSTLTSTGVTNYPVNVNSLGFSITIDARDIPDYNLSTTDVLLRDNSVLILLPPSLDKCVKITTESPCYLYDGDTLVQSGTFASGKIIGNVFNGKTIILKEVTKNFEPSNTNLASASIEVINLVVDKISTYTAGSEISLTNGKQAIILSTSSSRINLASNTFVNGEPVVFSTSFAGLLTNKIYYVVNATPTNFQVSTTLNGSPSLLSDVSSPGSVVFSQKAYGVILESTDQKNVCKIRVTRGNFEVNSSYFLRTNDLKDTVGSKIVQKIPLSYDIKVLTSTDKIAILKTDENHEVSVDDNIIVDIIPDDVNTTTTIYTRRKIYQKVKLSTPIYNKILVDSGVGRIVLLNSGADYGYDTNGNTTLTNVELIFADQTKCRGETGQIASSISDAIIGNPGSQNNARATLIVTNGLITSITITNKGKFYKKGDILTVSPEAAYRNPQSSSTRKLLIEVDHAGLSASNTKVFLNEVTSISNTDYLKIDNEILQVVSINTSENSVTVLRGQKSTTPSDHIQSRIVSSESPQYKLGFNYQIGSTVADPYVDSYDPLTGELVLTFEPGNTVSTINPVTSSSFFYDQNTPRKLVGVIDVLESPAFKFEFSYDNVNWKKNPIIPIQKYYKYKFDTSHPSLAGSFLEFSPSGNLNILTSEVERSLAIPGFSNSYIALKIGFGANISTNNFTDKKNTEFTNYYYYDKNSVIDSEKSYLRLIEDPLQGEHKVIYTTPTEMVYEVSNYPQYSGYGTISYTTTSTTAIGSINSVKIINSGSNMSSIPFVNGVRPSSFTECVVDVEWNPDTKSIIGLSIVNRGSNYSKPKAVVVLGDGRDAVIDVRKSTDNSIAAVILVNGGSGYTFKPEIRIIETDVKMYFNSKTIGIPQKVSIIQNGRSFNSDYTTKRKITSHRILILKNFQEKAFFENEIIEQYEGNVLIAKGYVSKEGWREGSNILRLNRVEGEFKNNLSIIGKTQSKTAIVVSSFVGEFNYDIKSYYDNLGYFASDKSKLSTSSQKLTDSYFYQDYSYVVRSRTPIDIWRSLVKSSTHPAGFKLFGEVFIESDGVARMKSDPPRLDSVSTIQLWDPQKNKVTVENTYRTVTQSILNSSLIDVQRGKGALFVNSFDDAETSSFEIVLDPPFSGYFDSNGNRAGNKVFTMKILGSNNPVAAPQQENLVISLDGIVQQPGLAFTVSNTQITFKEAPLGYRNKQGQSITPLQYVEGVDTPSQKFIGKILRYKDLSVNSQFFKKIKDISSQFNGVKTNFELYDDLNNNIILESGNNLLVTIDGVLQTAGITPTFPIDRSYYIRRNVTPNQIVFTEPPKSGQVFGAYSISSYEIAEIDSALVDGITYGPFIMRRTLNKKPLEVFIDNNILVFVDRILQKKTKDYSIQGSSIRFTSPPQPGQKIRILYYYGRSVSTSITAFNYEEDTYFNLIKINLNYVPALAQYADRICYQGSSLTNYTAIGKAKGVSVTNTGSTLNVEAQNAPFDPDFDITIVDGLASGLGDLVIPASSIVSVSDFERDDETLGILQKTNSGWLIGSSLSRTSPNFIDIGDRIRIDGEKSYRTILSTPQQVYKTQYNANSSIANNFFGRLSVTPNEEVGKGEGLSVTASIQNGSVIQLEWNDRNYSQYGLSKIQPGAYGYENAPKLIFVPQPLRNEGGTIIAPAQGGGASGFAVVSAGEVIDIVLTNGGSNYLTAPRVYIAKGFDIIKNPEKKVTTKVELTFFPEIKTTLLISALVNLEYGFAVHEAESIISPTELLATSTVITTGINSLQESVPVVDIKYDSVVTETTFNLVTNLNSVVSLRNEIIVTAHTIWDDVKSSSVNSISQEIIKSIPTGFSDIYADPEISSISFNPLTLGSTLKKFENGAFNDMGFLEIGGISLDQFDRVYGNITIEDFELRSMSSKAVTEETLMNLGYGSTNELGAYLQMPLTTSSTIIYVANTNGFPSSGKLLVNGEVVTYTSKLSDRFIDVSRGQYNTIPSSHNAGDYLRTFGTEASASNIVNLAPVLPTYSIVSGTKSPLFGANAGAYPPTVDWTGLQNVSADDAFLTINLPFTFYIAGSGYTTTYMGSNTYLTFGSGSNLFNGLSASNPALPKFMFGCADNSYQRVSRYAFGTDYQRIRYEGTNSTGGTVGSPNIVIEITLFNPALMGGKNVLELLVGTHARTTGVRNVASATTQYATYTLSQNESYVFEGNNDGTAWTILSGYNVSY